MVSVLCVSPMWFVPFVSVLVSVKVCIPIIGHLHTVTSLREFVILYVVCLVRLECYTDLVGAVCSHIGEH